MPYDVEQLQFRRQKASHRGIAGLSKLRCLWVHKANQDLIEEISQLANLEALHIRGITATSLTSLGRNRKLRRLIIMGGTKIEDFQWAMELPATLEVCSSRISQKSPTALGIEGSMTTHVRIDTLEPLARLHNLRYLFLASARVQDKSLSPLRELTGLERLECRFHFPDQEFVELRKSLPDLSCHWIKMIEEYGSLRKGNAAMMARISRS